MAAHITDSEGGRDFVRGISLALPLLFWPFIAQPYPGFLVGTFLVVLVPLCVARTATQLIVVLFAYFGVDGYLRLLFEYQWTIYELPLIATLLVYLRWFFGPQWARSRGMFRKSPIAIPLLGLVGLYGIQLLNGVPWNPIVSVGGFVYHLGTVPLFFVASSGFRDKARIRRILWFTVGLALFECVYALGQYYLGPSASLAVSQHYRARMTAEAWWTPGRSDLIYRPTGLTLGGGGPGMYGLIGVVLTLGLVNGWRSAIWLKVTVLIGAFAMLIALFLSAIRAFWLGLLAALIVFGILRGVRYVTLIGGLGWAAAAVAATWTRGALNARLSTLLTPWALFANERGSEIAQLPNIVAQYPMGIGLGRAAGSAAGQARALLPEGVYGGAHNYWVSLAWEASIIAPLLLGWLLWRLLAVGLAALRCAPDRGTRSVVAAIVAFDTAVVAMTFAGPTLAGMASSFAQYFWFLSGLLFALASTSATPSIPAQGAPPIARHSVAE